MAFNVRFGLRNFCLIQNSFIGLPKSVL